MVRRGPLVIVTAALAFVACAKFSGEGDTPATDGGIDGAPMDGSMADRGDDPAIDGGTRADGGCKTVHAFCDDFDGLAVGMTPAWSLAPTIESGATAAVRGFSASISAPNVLDVRTTNAGKAVLSNQIPVMRGAKCSFAFQVLEREPFKTAPSIASLRLNASQGAYYEVDIRLEDIVSAGKLADGGIPEPKLQAIDTTPDMKWKTMTIAMFFGFEGYVRVDLDAKPIFTIEGGPMLGYTAGSATSAVLGLGLRPLSAQGSFHVVYDDVVCDPLQ